MGACDELDQAINGSISVKNTHPLEYASRALAAVSGEDAYVRWGMGDDPGSIVVDPDDPPDAK